MQLLHFLDPVIRSRAWCLAFVAAGRQFMELVELDAL